jgi:hypothetical protein
MSGQSDAVRSRARLIIWRRRVSADGRPLLLDPIQAVGHPLKPLLQLQARGRQGRPAIIGDGAAHRRAIALPNSRLGIGVLRHGSLDPADPAHLLPEFLLGMPVRLEDRVSRLTQEMKVAELMRHPRQRLGHRLADGGLTIADDARDGHTHRVYGLAQQSGQILRGAGEKAARQDHDP